MGLLALMLLHESRRAARTSPDGRPGPAGGPGPLALEPGADRGRDGAGGAGAGVAPVRPVHPPGGDRGGARRGAAPPPRPTGPRSSALYDVLAQVEPSPVVELNRAVAVAMRDGPAAGLALIDAILARGDLADYHLAHAARADLCRRLGTNGGGPRRLRAGARPRRSRSRSGGSSRAAARVARLTRQPPVSSPVGEGAVGGDGTGRSSSFVRRNPGERPWQRKQRGPRGSTRRRRSRSRPVEKAERICGPDKLMLYPNGRAVDDVIRTIREGGAMAPKELRAELARRHCAGHHLSGHDRDLPPRRRRGRLRGVRRRHADRGGRAGLGGCSTRSHPLSRRSPSTPPSSSINEPAKVCEAGGRVVDFGRRRTTT